jgi:hypothetical protein
MHVEVPILEGVVAPFDHRLSQLELPGDSLDEDVPARKPLLLEHDAGIKLGVCRLQIATFLVSLVL